MLLKLVIDVLADGSVYFGDLLYLLFELAPGSQCGVDLCELGMFGGHADEVGVREHTLQWNCHFISQTKVS